MKTIEELTDELLLFFNGFASWESSVIRSSDLTVSEAHAIEVLGQYGKMNMKNLAQKLGVTTGTTTVLLSGHGTTLLRRDGMLVITYG